MHKIIFSGVVTIAMLAAPTLVSAQGDWRVVQDGADMMCHASNQPPGANQAEVGGPFATESEAEAAIADIASCSQALTEDDDDDETLQDADGDDE